MYDTTSLEKLKVTPEAEDKRYLVVAMLWNQLARELRINKSNTISGFNPAAFER